MINNIKIQSNDYFSEIGFKNNFNYHLKNTISAGKIMLSTIQVLMSN